MAADGGMPPKLNCSFQNIYFGVHSKILKVRKNEKVWQVNCIEKICCVYQLIQHERDNDC